MNEPLPPNLAKLAEYQARQAQVAAAVPVVTDPPALAPTALHGLAGDVVRTIAPTTEAADAAILVQFLTAFGNCVGRSPYFMVEADEHRLNLFAILVGRSGKGRKGTSWNQVKRLFRAADDEWSRVTEQDGTGGNIVSGLSSGEGLIWEVRDPIEKEEAIKEKGRVTGERQMVLVDAGVKDKRRLVVESEFASPLKMASREGNVLSPVLRQAWECGDLRVMTKNSPARATGAHISVLGHITEDELRRLLTETDIANGFGNRFLFVAVERSKLLPEGGKLTPDALEPLTRRLARVLDAARRMGMMERDEAARVLWARVYPELTAACPGIAGSLTGRAEAQVLRLSMAYAVLDESAVIRAEHLAAALALWSYCEQSVKYIFGDVLGDPTADRIAEMLHDAGEDGQTRTQLYTRMGKHKPSAEISRALSVLAGRGQVRSERVSTDGREAEVWFWTGGTR